MENYQIFEVLFSANKVKVIIPGGAMMRYLATSLLLLILSMHVSATTEIVIHDGNEYTTYSDFLDALDNGLGSSPGTMYLPPGTFTIPSARQPITLELQQRIIGQGRSATTIRGGDSAKAIIKIRNGDVLLKGVSINHASATSSVGADGIIIQSGYDEDIFNVVIEDCIISNCYNGINIDGDPTPRVTDQWWYPEIGMRGIALRGNLIHNNYAWGVYAKAAHGLIMKENEIVSNGNTADYWAGGGFLWGLHVSVWVRYKNSYER